MAGSAAGSSTSANRSTGGSVAGSTSSSVAGSSGATGRLPTVHAVVYAQLREGRLLRARAFFDLHDAGMQLGVFPKPGTAGSRALLMLRGFGLRNG